MMCSIVWWKCVYIFPCMAHCIMDCCSLSVDLAARLQELKKDDETIDGFGKAMKDWVSICPWLSYCIYVACVNVCILRY